MPVAPFIPLPKQSYYWLYGVITTAHSNREDLLASTIESLALAGFASPFIFVDGAEELATKQYSTILARYRRVATRAVVGPFANWLLGLYWLYLSNPQAHYYAMFQDDLLACKNLRSYIDATPIPSKGYANLFTVPKNRDFIQKPANLAETSNPPRRGWHESDQRGRGALALVFPREALLAVLSSRIIVEKPLRPGNQAWKNIDGTVVTAMNEAGYKEYIHYPSLVQHTGRESTIGNEGFPYSEDFWGSEFDAMSLLE